VGWRALGVYTQSVLKEIGAAVAAERARQRLATRDLGIDPRIVDDLEAGRPGITTTQLETIATKLQVDLVALRAGQVLARPRPSVFLLHRGTQDFDDAELPVLDAALDHARTRNALGRLLGDDLGVFPRGQLTPRPCAADVPNAPAHQGYQLARELRRTIDNETSELTDVRELAEATVGLTLVVRQLSTIGSSAFSIKAGDAAAIVLAPTSQVREPHTRVWVAHELCHVLFDPDDGGVSVAVDFEVDRRAYRSEQRARAFAAELLLPEAGLRRLLGSPNEVSGERASKNLVAAARDAYGTTWQVAANHLCNLRFVRSELRAWLESQQPIPLTRTWTTTLPREGMPSLHIEALVRRAYECGHLTDGEARAILGIDRLSPLPWDR
jgi:Zn-dependent peptidase ImmA (M78 family)